MLTGMNGTVAPALALRLRTAHTVVQWDRSAHPIDSEDAVRQFLDRSAPDAVCHIATGDPQWARWIAEWCAARRVRMLWTGSVSVFSSGTPAPIAPDATPNATDDYGSYKTHCEKLVREACPDAVVARLGWQIGRTPAGNTMTGFLDRTARENSGLIRASTRWTPSCALLEDTAAGLEKLIPTPHRGVFHLEGNSQGLSFFDIAQRIRTRLGAAWTLQPADEPAFDNRMTDPRIDMGRLSDRLSAG
ncbi:MAG: sugar nucleotide-binding protein [Planctomycetota bacterium]|nr:sugar nucleotide-binding protein [Planctomycetota bacterium]